MTITIATSADVGAPVMNSAAGALIPILDWFLVGKLGWTKEFTNDTTGAVYRPSSGLRAYYQFNHATSGSPTLRMFKSMTAWDTGTGGTTAIFVPFSTTTTPNATVEHSYSLVSDGTFVFMIIQNTNPSYGNGLTMFGDFISFLPGDENYAFVSGTNTVSYSQYGHENNTTLNPCRKVLTASDQATTNASAALFASPAFVQAYIGGSSVLLPNEVTGGIPLFPVFLGEAGPLIRGKIPGLISPAQVTALAAGQEFAPILGPQKPILSASLALIFASTAGVVTTSALGKISLTVSTPK